MEDETHIDGDEGGEEEKEEEKEEEEKEEEEEEEANQYHSEEIYPIMTLSCPIADFASQNDIFVG